MALKPDSVGLTPALKKIPFKLPQVGRALIENLLGPFPLFHFKAVVLDHRRHAEARCQSESADESGNRRLAADPFHNATRWRGLHSRDRLAFGKAIKGPCHLAGASVALDRVFVQAL